MTTVVPDRLGRRRLARFERAAIALALEGTIPLLSDDPEEQEELDAAHAAIRHEYARAKALLLDHLDSQALANVDLQERASSDHAAVLAEYKRCQHLWANPNESADLFNIEGEEDIARYYRFRLEGLGFALDRLAKYRGKADV